MLVFLSTHDFWTRRCVRKRPGHSLVETFPGTGWPGIGEFVIHIIQKTTCNHFRALIRHRTAPLKDNTVRSHRAIGPPLRADKPPGLEQVIFRDRNPSLEETRWGCQIVRPHFGPQAEVVGWPQTVITKSSVYDGLGNQTGRVDARGYRTTYLYDADQNVTGRKYGDGTRATFV